MKIYLVALMTHLMGMGVEPPVAYIFTTHIFDSKEECSQFAVDNSDEIMTKLWMEFGPNYSPHIISCVDQDTVDDIEILGAHDE